MSGNWKQLFSLITVASGAFLPSDNIPWKAYKQCGIRSKVKTIDEPIFGRRKRDSLDSDWFNSENEFDLDRVARSAADTRIANGRSMDLEGEWPWMSILVKEGTEDFFDPEVECVGVLINCNAVLTTASCAQNSKVGNEIRVGTPTGPNSTVRRKIEKILIHPAFTTTRKDQSIDIHHNNVAIVFVDSPVTESTLFENGQVAPVCHTNDSSHLNDNCWALGVTTGPDQPVGQNPRMSASVQLDVTRQSLKYCNEYGYGGQLDEKQHMCIRSKWESEKSGFCNLADNGAPVICKRANSQNEFFLLGMYSSSEGCSTFPKPAIFQETASFDDWIQETIQKEKKCLCHKVIPGRQLIAPNMCCLNTPYNSGLKECCGGKLLDLEGNHKCCFGVAYDNRTHTCSKEDGLIIQI